MEGTYTFVIAENRTKESLLNNLDIQQMLMKWSMKGQLNLQTFCYSEPFQAYQKQEFVNSFFRSEVVISSLLRKTNYGWTPVGQKAVAVEVKEIPCCITTMAVFKNLTNPENGIVRGEGWLIKCELEEVDEFEIGDKLRKVLLDKECECYNIVPASVRKEFIFQLFKHFCLGGKLCQYEDNISEYINITKAFYKDLIRVQKNPNTKELVVKSVVLKVVAKDGNGVAYFPVHPENEQNIAYLIVDTVERKVTTFVHHYGASFEDN